MYSRPFRLVKMFVLCLCSIIVIVEILHVFASNSRRKSSKEMLVVSSPPSVKVMEGDFQEIVSSLAPFYVALPQFFDDEARHWFLNSTYYRIHSTKCPHGACDQRGFLFDNSKEHLTVRLAVVKNGLYANDDCGYNYGDQQVRRTWTTNTSSVDELIYDQAILYPVPDGWSFQHFLDGIGPKLSHSRSYLDQYPRAKVIVLQGARFDRSVKEIWSMLGVDESKRIVHYTGNRRVGARLLINPCRTPGIHPHLWHEARLMYWSISSLSSRGPAESQWKNFIYIQRTSSNAMNGARLVLNEQPFTSLLRAYCASHSLNYIEYDHSKDSSHIRHRIQLFFNARFIIGVHSGALANMNFSPAGTTVIELMPYRPATPSLPLTCSMFREDDLKACAGYILYTQSQLLNQTYWIFPHQTNAQGNFHVNLTRLATLLEKI